MGVARQVAAAMGWSLPYTLGVLGRWKVGIEEMTTVDIGEASTIDRSAVAGSLDRLAEHLAAIPRQTCHHRWR